MVNLSEYYIVGTEVYRKNITSTTKSEIDLSGLVCGSYVIKLNYGERQFQDKLVIQK